MLVYDLVDPAELTGFARSLEFPEIVLDGILGNEETNDIRYSLKRATLNRRAATYRSFDAEARIASRGRLAEIEGEILPISEKIRFGEYDILRARAMDGDRGARREIVDSIYDDARNRTFAVQARAEIARGDVLTDGKFTLEDEDGLTLEVDFGVPGSHLVAPGTLWSNTAASTPITDLKAWKAIWKASNNGQDPGALVMSDDVVANLTLSAQVRALLAVGGVSPAFATEAQVNTVLAAHGLPPIVRYNGQFEDYLGNTVYPIPRDRVLMLPANGAQLGRTLYAPTAEALELATEGRLRRQDVPGIVAVVDKTFDPVSIWTKAAGIIVPVLGDPNKLLVADVQ